MEFDNKTSEDDNTSKSVNSFQDINTLFSEEEALEMRYKNNSYDVASLMMYLTGVEERHFDDHKPVLSEQYETFNKDEDARIIRDLSIIRTALIGNFSTIRRVLLSSINSLSTIPDYIPPESVLELENAGISFQGGKVDLNNYIKKINQEMANRINSVQHLFPDWINWEYVRPLFLMPNGSKTETFKDAADFYNSDRNRYPYQVWLNWTEDDRGNIFLNDYKFVSILYEVNGDVFEDKSLIRGTDNDILVNLYDFIGRNKNVLVVVDCENSDPIKLAAVLFSLNEEQMSSIKKIIFFDSANTTRAWETLCNTGITDEFEMEHKVVTGLYEYKSQVDMQLAVDVSKEVCMNSVDAVIIAASDSDYWTLIKNFPDTNFLVMLEKMKSGSTIRDTLQQHGYPYCFIDDFCTGKAYIIKTDTILNSIQKQIDEKVDFNVREMMEEEAKTSWLSLSEKEANNLYDRYLKTMKLKVESDGTVRLIIKE